MALHLAASRADHYPPPFPCRIARGFTRLSLWAIYPWPNRLGCQLSRGTDLMNATDDYLPPCLLCHVLRSFAMADCRLFVRIGLPSVSSSASVWAQ
jgi:hypothetical protein